MFNRRTLLGSALATAAAAPNGLLAATPAAQARRNGARNASGRIKTKDSTELYVKDWGSGRPMVLTHAWPLSNDCWDQQAIALADAGYRVITYDRRGFGRSGQPPTGYGYDTFADDLSAVIDAVGAKDVALIGFSMGGGEIVRYLSRHGAKGRRSSSTTAPRTACWSRSGSASRAICSSSWRLDRNARCSA
jgi:pimeloyl-ACP methyl ester carboxylesterase